MILSIGGAITHQLEHGLFNLSEREVGGVQVLGIGSLSEGSFRAAAISLIAGIKIAGDVFDRGAQLGSPPLGAGVGAGRSGRRGGPRS